MITFGINWDIRQIMRRDYFSFLWFIVTLSSHSFTIQIAMLSGQCSSFYRVYFDKNTSNNFSLDQNQFTRLCDPTKDICHVNMLHIERLLLKIETHTLHYVFIKCPMWKGYWSAFLFNLTIFVEMESSVFSVLIRTLLNIFSFGQQFVGNCYSVFIRWTWMSLLLMNIDALGTQYPVYQLEFHKMELAIETASMKIDSQFFIFFSLQRNASISFWLIQLLNVRIQLTESVFLLTGNIVQSVALYWSYPISNPISRLLWYKKCIVNSIFRKYEWAQHGVPLCMHRDRKYLHQSSTSSNGQKKI